MIIIIVNSVTSHTSPPVIRLSLVNAFPLLSKVHNSGKALTSDNGITGGDVCGVTELTIIIIIIRPEGSANRAD